MPDRDPDDIRHSFAEVVNLTAAELETWLESDESCEVGIADGRAKTASGGAESTGHESGRRIVTLLRTRKDDLDEEDLAHMKKVVGYVHRHLAQRPGDGDLASSRWRYSLMNWGHDPLKD